MSGPHRDPSTHRQARLARFRGGREAGPRPTGPAGPELCLGGMGMRAVRLLMVSITWLYWLYDVEAYELGRCLPLC